MKASAKKALIGSGILAAVGAVAVGAVKAVHCARHGTLHELLC